MIKRSFHLLHQYVVFLGIFTLSVLIASPLQAATPDKKLYDICDAAYPGILKDLETLVNMDSGSNDYPELLKKQEVLVEMLKKAKGDVQIVPAPAPREGTNNIVATWKGKGKAKIMIMNHYDTVWSKGESAKRPFAIKDGIASGPGVVDSQCNVVAAITLMDILVNKLKENNFAVITVLLNADEEIGSKGSRDLIMELAAKHDVVYSLDGGGADGDKILISARGGGAYKMLVKGRESHSGGAPEKGINAGYELAFQLLQMRDLSDKSIRTGVNWTLGQFGTKSNVIPGTAWAQADVRVTKLSELDRIEKTMLERAKTKLFPESEITFDFQRGRPPFEPNPTTDSIAEKVVKIAKDELDKTIIPIHAGGGTDSNYSFQKAPALDGMGFGSKGSHTVNEALPVKNITPRMYLLVRTVQETMKGKVVSFRKY